MQDFKAFTKGFPGRTSVLSCAVEISKATVTGESVKIYPALAIWDTGANCCCITSAVVNALELKAVRMVSVLTGAGDVFQNVYEICVHLPSNVAINVVATEIPALSGGMEALIGMNIIGLGDFAISNFDGRTQMTFRVPSVADADYT